MVELLDIELAHLGQMPDGRRFEWEAVGQGEPMLWIEGRPRPAGSPRTPRRGAVR